MVELSAPTKLLKEFKHRSEKNRRYSLRAFARDLGLPASHLSEFLSNKRTLSAAQIERIVYRLGYDYREANEFISTLENQRTKKRSFEKAFVPLNQDAFSLIADWQNYAILNLMRTKNFKSDTAWIADRLGLQLDVAEKAIQRLERLQLIEKREGGLVRVAKNLTTSQDIPSEALRESHRQDFQNALKSLIETPSDQRDITSITMAIDPDKIPLAKKMIRAFRRKLSETLESGSQTEVYNLNIQLVPISRKSSKVRP
jgi:uncharacterized protein (TIGR02147 family)